MLLHGFFYLCGNGHYKIKYKYIVVKPIHSLLYSESKIKTYFISDFTSYSTVVESYILYKYVCIYTFFNKWLWTALCLKYSRINIKSFASMRLTSTYAFISDLILKYQLTPRVLMGYFCIIHQSIILLSLCFSLNGQS